MASYSEEEKQEIHRLVCEGLRYGDLNLDSLCEKQHTTRQAYIRWRKKNPKMQAEYKNAQKNRSIRIRREIKELAITGLKEALVSKIVKTENQVIDRDGKLQTLESQKYIPANAALIIYTLSNSADKKNWRRKDYVEKPAEYSTGVLNTFADCCIKLERGEMSPDIFAAVCEVMGFTKAQIDVAIAAAKKVEGDTNITFAGGENEPKDYYANIEAAIKSSHSEPETKP